MMFMKTKLSLTLSLLFFCVSVFAQKETTIQLYKTKTFEVAIFPAGNDSCFPIPDFTPTHSEVDLAEAALAKDLEKLNQQRINQIHTPIIHKNLKKYRRQYLGYIDANGDKILIINCLFGKNESFYGDFLTRWIEVKDGGSYYWTIKYNITKNELFDLSVNGYA